MSSPILVVLGLMISLLLTATVVEGGGWTTVSTVTSPFNSHVLLNKDTVGDCAVPFGTNGTNNLFWTPEALQISTTSSTKLNAIQATPYYFPVLFFFSSSSFLCGSFETD